MKKLPYRIVGIKAIDIFINAVLFIIGLYSIGYLFGVLFGLIG